MVKNVCSPCQWVIENPKYLSASQHSASTKQTTTNCKMRTDILGQNLESSRTFVFSQLISKPENNETSSVFLSRLGINESSFPKRSFAVTWPHCFRKLCELCVYENGLLFFFCPATSSNCCVSRSSNGTAATELWSDLFSVVSCTDPPCILLPVKQCMFSLEGRHTFKDNLSLPLEADWLSISSDRC